MKEELLELLKKQTKENGYVPYWITSFTDLDKYQSLHEAQEAVYDLMVEYIQIFQNIMSQTSFTLDSTAGMYDPLSAVNLIQDATQQYVQRLKSLPAIRELSMKGILTKDSETSTNVSTNVTKDFVTMNVLATDNSITIKADSFEPIVNKEVGLFKDADGNLRWMGVVTNIYKDRDGDILTKEAHIDFIDAIEKGEWEYPELWIWHLDKAVGDTDYVGFDERGFVVASGIVDKEYEELVTNLVKNTPNMGMSHGMPVKELKRYKNGKLKRYRSKEFSLLPVDNAANLLTYYHTKFNEV